jgi:2-amino-4-hydroxy-6-hydroxymethyldihydropteridine diphosphokinase
LNSAPSLVAIALGSNLGERERHLDVALDRLARFLDGMLVSSRYETAPVGVPASQPDYLNAAAVGRTGLPPHALLAALQAIEAGRGRERPYANAPRTLDLDLILYDGLVISDEQLVIPHPRFRERAFVLEPLVEIAPDLVDPVTGLTLDALWKRLRQGPSGPAR